DQGACPKITKEEIQQRMVCLPTDPRDFNLFLSKFRFLDSIKWTEDLVATKIKMVCEGMHQEHLAGAMLDFSVSKYRHIGWSLKEAITFILDRLDEYSSIPIIPILSIKYESPEDVQLKIAGIINDDE